MRTYHAAYVRRWFFSVEADSRAEAERLVMAAMENMDDAEDENTVEFMRRPDGRAVLIGAGDARPADVDK